MKFQLVLYGWLSAGGLTGWLSSSEGNNNKNDERKTRNGEKNLHLIAEQ